MEQESNTLSSRTGRQQQQQQHAGRPQPSEPHQYDGDVSTWGRTQLVDSLHDSEVEPEISELSSGVSPRDLRPRVRPFDMDTATEALAYQSSMFSRAQALRRDGCAPPAWGVPDDLPTRMAYQQLNTLAGMAGKVQDAILHNKRIFEQRLLSEDRALQRRVLYAWQSVVQWTTAKHARLVRAQGRLKRGLLLRVFFSWKSELHLVDRTLEMKRKVSAVTAAGCVRRCFQCWLALAHERWWKTQLSSMEAHVGVLEVKLRGYEKRPVQVLRKRRLDRLLSAWLVEAVWSRHKRQQLSKAVSCSRRHTQQQAWAAWQIFVAVKARQRVLAQRVVKACQHIKQQAAWDAWLQVIDCKQVERQQLGVAARHHRHKAQLKAWRAWQGRTKQHQSTRAAASRWKRSYLARAFKFWLWHAGKQRRHRVALNRSLAKRQRQLLLQAYSGWVEYVQHRKLKAQLGEAQTLAAKLQALDSENARLRRDNERFVRLIDSGEWGRGRVEELQAAGELMRAERDALLKLVQALRLEYEAVQLAKEAQRDELRGLKDKMTVKGAARNCLLVKGGSSFNALVRALKQDLIDSGTAAKDPALLYQIDKLSMDRVQVFPDGELNIEAVTSEPLQDCSSKSSTWHRQPGSPPRRGQLHAHTQRSSSPASAAQRITAAVQRSGSTEAAVVNPQLRIKVGGHSSSSCSSPSNSPTAAKALAGLAAATGACYSPKAAGLGGSPLRHTGSAGLTSAAAAAAAAAAAVVASRHSPVKSASLGCRGSSASSSPVAGGRVLQPGLVSTDSMLQALSSLTPAQVQRLQQQAGDPRLLSTAPATKTPTGSTAAAGPHGRTRSSSSGHS